MYQPKKRSLVALLTALLFSSSCIFSQETNDSSGGDMARLDMATPDQSGAPDLGAPDMPPAPDMSASPDMTAPTDMDAPDQDAPDMSGPADMDSPDAPCEPETERELCGQRACGHLVATDSCGVERKMSCGECINGAMCSSDNICVRACQPEDNKAFCSRNGAACGVITALDNCDVSRTVECDPCVTGGRCLDNQCSGSTCMPEDDSAFCSRILQAGCGLATGTDNCGKPRCVADCNPCLAVLSCCVNHTCQLQAIDACPASACPVDEL